MKVIISVQEPDLNAKLDPRFGRAKYFLTIDPDTMQWEAHANSAIEQAHGAGIAAAQWASEQGAQLVISGDFGPNASRTLRAAGLEMLLFKTEQTVEEALHSYKNGQLQHP